ncbi:MAG TPA: LON peptidase substrate-binding domain-containing protein, partial [Dehalococcoidia bacterium]|nr:LON peptidase substrate-binding domain-containing protein [Dehalococcoidia bacterium]
MNSRSDQTQGDQHSQADLRATELRVPETIPVIPSGTTIVYPQQLMPVLAAEERDIKAINAAASSPGKMLAIFSHPAPPPVTGEEPARPEAEEGIPKFRQIGTAATVVRMAKSPDGTVHAILQGSARVRLVAIESEGPPIIARVEPLPDRGERTLQLEAVMR